MHRCVRMVIAAAICVSAASAAWGQGRSSAPTQVPRYVPSSPTVSPYVNLLNRNGSVAGNYFGLVRPLQRQAAINARQTQIIESQEQQLREVQNQQQQQMFEQPDVKPTGTAGWFQNMGATSPYMVNSHYYGQWQSGRQGKRGGR